MTGKSNETGLAVLIRCNYFGTIFFGSSSTFFTCPIMS
jgi:hypothetical protein